MYQNICEKGKNAFDKSKIYLNRFSQIRKIELQYNCNWMIKKRIAKELQFTMLIRIFLILISAVIAMKGKFEFSTKVYLNMYQRRNYIIYENYHFKSTKYGF